MNALPQSNGLLILPHLRIQNANAISSPLTHGFPAMTAFLGLMWALERKLSGRHPITFDAVGVICHDHDEQTTEGGYTKAFRLTRNPVDKDGSTAAIVEEGRIHLDVTLVFSVSGGFAERDEAERQVIADAIADVLAGMRLAGGSVLPPQRPRWQTMPKLIVMAETPADAARQFRQLRRRWLPGFTLVCRDDLLQKRILGLRTANPAASALDAWLDLSRFNWNPAPMEKSDDAKSKVEWKHDRSEGWIVPIPVGYGALSDPHPPGTVQNARDQTTAFRFVESLYSIGQWISPHRLADVRELLWYAHSNAPNGLYRCNNDYARTVSATHD